MSASVAVRVAEYDNDIFDPAVGVRIPALGSGVGVVCDACYCRNHWRCSGVVVTAADHLFHGAAVDCICPVCKH